MENKIRVVIIEDNPNYSHSVQSALELFEETICVGIYRSFEGFRESFPKQFDCILNQFDINLTGCSGIDALPEIKSEFPQSEIRLHAYAK